MFVGSTQINTAKKQAKGRFVTMQGEKFYLIENFDAMQPFFISLASDTDLWMYLSSTGGLTCGRKSPDQALFPYYTDDKITENFLHTGPKTILKITRDEKTQLWEPFTDRYEGIYKIQRNIAKSVTGNKILFEEINETLGVSFSYLWCSADKYGWIREASLRNDNFGAVEIEFLDGLQNILPAGTNRLTQNTYSTLVDGYKKTELINDSSLVLFRMEAIMVDRAEPSESLRCNTMYCLGLQQADYLTSSRQLDAFRRNLPIVAEPEAKGVRGACFAHGRVALMVGAEKSWFFVADVEKDAADVYDILAAAKEPDAIAHIKEAVEAAGKTLRTIVGQNDGIQLSADEHINARHFANALFNTMRGGFYCDNYTISARAFMKHVALFNKALAEKHNAFLSSLPDKIAYSELETLVLKQGDAQLHRLFLEYLPLTFSRRHGDPSRPWNLFSIRVNDEQGNRLISYQGNWRDIFQNWEALSLSYPGYINGIIAKFLNATTVDGYNPYKVTSEGIDWEVINPDDPWSNIGYWGDHQIIYLLKLLELSYQHDPKALEAMLNERLFAFANVPYRLKAYKDIVADPKNSITFDDDLHKQIFVALPAYGQDARLVLDANNEVYLTTFVDKILVTLLAKLSNFIPEAGIWMNTLRPEWNDANNALVGFGASMVTLCYMRRFVKFFQKVLEQAPADSLVMSQEIAEMYLEMSATLQKFSPALSSCFGNQTRRAFADAVGEAGETYRAKVYAGFSGKQTEVQKSDLLAFLRMAKAYIDQSIRVNKREDGLYNAYNLINYTTDGIEVKYLYQMLEGQVAVLTSGTLNAQEVCELLDKMRESDLYRADQNSYMLYPARRRASFLEKNNIPDDAKDWPVVKRLLATDIIRQDRNGGLHFNGGFNNADFLDKALKKTDVSAEERHQLLDLYERMFDHQAFTGRSGTFYKYEGLGCIYWHMVSKLLLAIGENISWAVDKKEEGTVIATLKIHYYDVQQGIGAHKQPAEYGSFPFDPYSHTPSMAGVQQPGMTGQVKEDIINRFFELGLHVQNGEMHIRKTMLRPEEFIDGKLYFTYCAVPFVYTLGAEEKGIWVEYADGSLQKFANRVLPAAICRHLFARDNAIKQIVVNF